MNVAEILKDAPKGTKLYSPVFGEVELDKVIGNRIIQVIPTTAQIDNYQFNTDGTYFYGGEIMLFPSKENRDWAKFEIEPQFPTTFQGCCRQLFLTADCEEHCEALKIEALRQLLIARDAWWKVDGDWKPNWKDNRQDKHYIYLYYNQFSNHSCNSFNRILVFRTKEIRDKFWTTFRDLIEQCKELI